MAVPWMAQCSSGLHQNEKRVCWQCHGSGKQNCRTHAKCSKASSSQTPAKVVPGKMDCRTLEWPRARRVRLTSSSHASGPRTCSWFQRLPSNMFYHHVLLKAALLRLAQPGYCGDCAGGECGGDCAGGECGGCRGDRSVSSCNSSDWCSSFQPCG